MINSRVVYSISIRAIPVSVFIYIICSRAGIDYLEMLFNVFTVSAIMGFVMFDFSVLRYSVTRGALSNIARGLLAGLMVGVVNLLAVFIFDWVIELLVYDFLTGELRLVEAWLYVLDFIAGVYLTLGGGVSV